MASSAASCTGPATRRGRSGRSSRPCRCISTAVTLAVITLRTGLASAPPAYGACNGLLTNACSYIYGEQRAAHSYRLVAALDLVAAKTAPWWLDVELMSSWAGNYQLNIAALQGFIAGLNNAGATGPIGIYSTSAQWKEITGLTAQTTPTAFNGQLLDWVAGTDATLTQARQNCTSGGFTGVAPNLAQYRIGPLDAVSKPDHEGPDPHAEDRARYYARGVGPSRWLMVVVSYEQVPARIVTAFANRKHPRSWSA